MGTDKVQVEWLVLTALGGLRMPISPEGRHLVDTLAVSENDDALE